MSKKPIKLNKKIVKSIMVKCLNRAKKHKKSFSFFMQNSFSDKDFLAAFNSINITFKYRKCCDGMMHEVYDKKNKKPIYTLEINPKAEWTQTTLDDLVAHELAHFFDYYEERESNHDFQFLHTFLILSNKTYSHYNTLEFMNQYMTKNEYYFHSYKKVLQGKTK